MTVARAFSEPSLEARFASLSPTLRAFADPPASAKGQAWLGLTPGWEILDLARLPNLELGEPDAAFQAEDARRINALRPVSREPLAKMPAFRLSGAGEDARRALTCLTQAVYYEAAREPEVGQAAVAQVVLNRLRHPGYPKSVCGVVYQGSARPTGCQFTFTCDGSLGRPPEPALWSAADAVARRALSGHVVREVGSATHYHADYVAPYWAPTLVKLAQIGAHIFYRWTGPSGEAGAFTGRYAGGEASLTPAILGGVDPRTQAGLEAFMAPPPPRTVTLALAGETRTYTISEPDAAGSAGLPAPGQLSPIRRRPTPEEIRRINAALAALEKGEPAPVVAGAGVQP
ncbi:MAG: cell wall hydrolase [Phenylobacterium sp.]|nr:cell wall hydrolase [Phenylobacterium sp.]MCA3758464.1 cell wall hydrolase [Phenylobacterium sp.]MCA6244743.1 cell wall hydrolase [Phenylobacterium sp.]MCA6278802.1 cell wall hydrolase [Phenylobacterium sp.]MCA6294041.1 cell wall hydrolase [Phenylobacterium sp.]